MISVFGLVESRLGVFLIILFLIAPPGISNAETQKPSRRLRIRRGRLQVIVDCFVELFVSFVSAAKINVGVSLVGSARLIEKFLICADSGREVAPRRRIDSVQMKFVSRSEVALVGQ